jgi:hypothetical protein
MLLLKVVPRIFLKKEKKPDYPSSPRNKNRLNIKILKWSATILILGV